MSEFRLHCFAQSGNSYKVALMMACARADWEPVFVDFFAGMTKSKAWRDSVNTMGEVPVLECDGRFITQSGIILDFLANRLSMFGGGEDEERSEIWRWILFDNHKFTSYLATYRWLRSFGDEPPSLEVISFLRSRIDAAFSIVDTHLQRHSFLVAERVTVADFSLSGYLFYPPSEIGYDLGASHPNIAAWLHRLSRLPGWRHPYDMLPGTIREPRFADIG